MRRMVIAGAIWCCVLGGWSEAARAESYGAQAGWGLAAVAATLLYAPVKIVYAGVGGMIGGIAFVLTGGNGEVFNRICSPAVGGTYLLTPAMLRGDEPIFFAGESYEAGPQKRKTS